MRGEHGSTGRVIRFVERLERIGQKYILRMIQREVQDERAFPLAWVPDTTCA
jgi:hypothetical protein